jgi:IclR family pca regulon transcriptional regulator
MLENNSVRSPEFVQSFERGLLVIQAFGEGHARMSLTEIAERAGLSRATARRFLITLTDLGFAHTDGQVFTLSPKVLNLGYSYLSSFGLPSLALPVMERTVSLLQESCSLSVLDGADIVYVARVSVSRIMSVRIDVGTRFAAFATSMGRVFLADLSERDREDLFYSAPRPQFTPHTITSFGELNQVLDVVSDRGFALACEELESGLLAIAVPIRQHRTGRVVAALNISANTAQRSKEFLLETALPVLLQAGEQIEQSILATGISIAAMNTFAANDQFAQQPALPTHHA